MKNYVESESRQSDIHPDGGVNCASAENEQKLDVFEEKFRVDRKKLELMLQGSNENNETAEHFFQRVMNETHTVITWPSKLKIGAKSKKDPHVKIAGQLLAIRNARVKIKAALDTKANQVTLKMDVSYCDHSHVIGKAGNTHKRLSSSTECLIHFPDSNRNSTTEKNNQVSISGPVHGVEKARGSIRELMPVVFNFDVPTAPWLFSTERTQYLQKLQLKYEVQIQYKQSTRMEMCTTLAVRGSEQRLQNVKNVVTSLIAEYTNSNTIFLPIFMTIEISPRHLGEVEENCRELKIDQQTRTHITFPDVNTMGPVTSKMTVTITGESIDGVYMARKMILGCLPLILLFDLSEDQQISRDIVAQVKDVYKISILAKAKPKTNSIQITVKGNEQNAKAMYKVREILLGVKESPEYSNGTNKAYSMTDAVAKPDFENVHFTDLDIVKMKARHMELTSLSLNANTCRSLRPMPDGYSTGGWNTSSHSTGCYPMQTTDSFPNVSDWISGMAGQEYEGGYFSAPSGTNSSLTTPDLSPRVSSPEDNYTNGHYNGSCSTEWTTYEQLSDMFLQFNSVAGSGGLATCVENVEMPSYDLTRGDKLPEIKSNGIVLNTDHLKLKLRASKAMKNIPKVPQVRVPNSSWSGYGFSNSLPEDILRELREKKLQRAEAFEENGNPPIEESAPTLDKNPWSNSSRQMLGTLPHSRLTTSNFTESFPHHSQALSVGHCTSLEELLAHVGLEKYARLFEQQDVDLGVFLKLTDQEMQTLGIKTFGALKKMRQAITSFKKEQNTFSPAPGAERKMSSSLSKSFSMGLKD